jgi:methionyl-tRNA formyltransferase
MKLVFAGTPEFAVPALSALLAAGHRILAVYTQPDRPAGRGRKLAQSPVKRFALEHGLEIRQPTSLKPDMEAEALRNVHASLLPRWRGAAPIQRAIEAGDPSTGVTIMQMEEGLDTGPMLATAETPITITDTGASLHDRLSTLGARLLVDTLTHLDQGAVTPQPQDGTQANYAAKLKKEEARLDWSSDAAALARRVRAFNPWPVATSTFNGQTLRVWMAHAEHGMHETTPGTVLSADAAGIRVQCGRDILCITQLQAEGGKPLDARTFLNGHPLAPGTRLGS